VHGDPSIVKLSSTAYRARNVIERIEEKLERIPEAGCWLYMGTVGKLGYAQTTVGRKHLLPHRVMFEHYKHSIPSGMQVDHLCRVRSCVNPHHLEAVTKSENVRRSSAPEVARNRMLSDRNPSRQMVAHKEDNQ